IKRFQAAGLEVLEEKNTHCCYAIQDKVWVSDPDGNRWEVFVVNVEDTAPEMNLKITDNSEQESNTVKSSCCG
ncbi:MAG: glyoxalase/bleomycin resistance/dioxygenase family protein, partial [Moorea sp. SIO4G2]|nr:glyoxalase/bleomycin resistance/dioxygenase family protein [Moorena sp. SIO4G2]